jgi:hypothetical protein
MVSVCRDFTIYYSYHQVVGGQRLPSTGDDQATPYAFVSFMLFICFGCWWALPCAVAGMVLGRLVSMVWDYSTHGTKTLS